MATAFNCDTEIQPPPGLRVHTNAWAGRSYFAARPFAAGDVIIEASTPYSYTIWKKFRTEVCAECWKYDAGRRTFLTRRDDDGFVAEVGQIETFEGQGEPKKEKKQRSGVGAGLWFCNERCQSGWINREGLETLDLLRTLEEARQRKEKGKTKEVTVSCPDESQMTQSHVDAAWADVLEKATNPKEVRKWRVLQLDDFETDVARYVLFALSHLAREGDPTAWEEATSANHMAEPRAAASGFGGASWSNFAALQNNELVHLRTYPELLDAQIRVFCALRGRFGLAPGRVKGRSARSSQSAELAEGVEREAVVVQQGGRGARNGKYGDGGDSMQGRAAWVGRLAEVVTVQNVRAALNVDPGNSFGIWEIPVSDESECLGFGVYPRESLFNHNCAPNVKTHKQNGRVMRMVATRDVAAGKELCISYGHVDVMGWRERQSELREGWFFDCRCSRCVAEMEADESLPRP